MGLGDVANLAVRLDLEGNFDKGVAGASKSLTGLSKAAGQTDKAVTQTTGKLGGLGKAAGSIKGTVLTGFGLGAGVVGFGLVAQGIGEVINFGTDAIGMASDLAEAQSKVNVVFGDGAKEVTEWARAADQALGLTDQAALEAAGTFGNFLQALGSTQSEAQDMSLRITELAADLASFNNVDIGEVLIALRAGLAGEAEPLRRLGVSLSAAREESILTARGIEKLNGKFKDSDRVMARYQAIFEDTTLAQGDFARTSDGAANSARRFEASLKDLQTGLGGLLIGPAQGFIDFLQRTVNVLSGTGNATDKVKGFAAAIREADEAADEAADSPGFKALTEADFIGAAPLQQIARALLPLAARLHLTEEELRQIAFTAFEASDGVAHLDETIETAKGGLRELLNTPVRSYFTQMGGGLSSVSGGFATLTDEVANTDDAISNAIVVTGAMGGTMLRTADGTIVMARSARTLALELEEVERAEARAERQADRLADALDEVANVSFKEVRQSANEARKAIERALDGDDKNVKSVHELQREIMRLMHQRRRAALENNSHAFALAQQRLDEAKGQLRLRQVERRRTTEFRKDVQDRQRAHRQAARQQERDIEDIADTYGVSTKRATNLLKRNRGDLEAVRLKLGTVEDAAVAVGDVDPSINVTTPGADRAIAKLDTLAASLGVGAGFLASVIIGGGRTRPHNVGQNAHGGLLYPGQYGTMGERGPERVANIGGVTVIEPIRGARERPLAVAVGVTFSAYQTNRQTRRVTDTRRQLANAL